MLNVWVHNYLHDCQDNTLTVKSDLNAESISCQENI